MAKVQCKTVKEILKGFGLINVNARVYKSDGTVLDLHGLPEWIQDFIMGALADYNIWGWQSNPVYLPSVYNLEYRGGRV